MLKTQWTARTAARSFWRIQARNSAPRHTFAGARHYASSEFGGKKDNGFNVMNFVVVALVGTGIFGIVVHKIDEQDPAKSMMKRKNSYSDQEWEQYMNSIKRKVHLFKPSTELYFVPHPDAKKVSGLVQKLGGDSQVHVVDLDDVIAEELEHHRDRYGTLLASHLVAETNGKNHQFDNKLASGIFTKLMKLKLEELKAASPDAVNKKYLLTNFPNNIQEAIKFESDVAVARKLVLFGDLKDDITDYFGTVHKVAVVKKVNDAAVASLQAD